MESTKFLDCFSNCYGAFGSSSNFERNFFQTGQSLDVKVICKFLW